MSVAFGGAVAGRIVELSHETTPGWWGVTGAPRSLSDTNLALGKYARVGSGRGHDARARGFVADSDDVAK